MTRKELIDELKYELVLSTADAMKAVDVAIRLIEEALSKGESVKISGFGTFHIKERRARNYWSKATGTLEQTIPSKRIQFRPSPLLLGLIQADTMEAPPSDTAAEE